MRIAFDHQIFAWQQYGGISRYAYELARALAASGEDEVIIAAPLYVNQYLRTVDPALRVLGRPVWPIHKTGRLLRDISLPLVRPLLRRLAPEIVHETYYCRSAVTCRPARTVLTMHDMIHELFPESFRPGDRTTADKRAAVARADHIICVSEQTRRDLMERFAVPADKMTVVHHGFSSMPLAAASSPVAGERPFFLYVGQRGGYKNFDGLLRAFAASPRLVRDFRVVCFGGGPLRPAERDLARTLGLDEEHLVQGAGSDSQLAALYRQAVAFVYPSRYEGFGIPPLEAMSFDCPVACARASAIPEVVGDAGVYFDPANLEEMTATLEALIDDAGLRDTLISRAHDRLRLFSWERCAAETRAVYRRTLDGIGVR